MTDTTRPDHAPRVILSERAHNSGEAIRITLQAVQGHVSRMENIADQLAAENAAIREKLLDPELAYDIASEMFMHGYEGDLTNADTVPPIAIGAVIAHLFGECRVCAEGEVRRRLKANAEGQHDE